jgi:hypothetical protein
VPENGSKKGGERAPAAKLRAAPPAPVCETDPYPRVQPGKRWVRCHKVQGPEWVRAYSRWSVRLECHFLDEEGDVSGFLNLDSDKERPRVRKQSRYAKVWTMANGRAPRKGDQMNPDVFLDRVFVVCVEDCATDRNGIAHPADAVYSRITEFIECMSPKADDES